MKSQIYTGNVIHHRSNPKKFTFNYPYYFYSIDLDELTNLQKHVKFFSHNRFNIVSIHDKDYLNGTGSIKQKMLHYLKEKNISDIKKIILITNARYFNYVFNPANFYYCYDSKGHVKCIVTEINNTYKEKHIYIMPVKLDKKNNYHTIQNKEFHVSPFNNMKGEYKMIFSEPSDEISVQISLYRDNKQIIFAQLTGKAKPFTSKVLISTICKFPLTAAKTLFRIHKEAFKLYFFKRLTFNSKPNPISDMTIKVRKPDRIERLSLFFFKQALGRATRGHLTVTLPDMSKLEFGKSKAKPSGSFRIRNWNLFKTFLTNREIGFGEAYVKGDWDSEDMTGFLDYYIANINEIGLEGGVLSFFSNLTNKITFKTMRNTRKMSRKNIMAHYDLGNDLFSSFLDKTMMYSSAIFSSSTDTLYKAQLNKIHSLIKKTGIEKNDHVLEIGSGWGGFAIEAVKKTGCRVTTVTISKEQYSYVKKKIKELGLSKNITILFSDYRDLKGKFDKIISIEMLEAVGRKYYGVFFKQCEKLLAPNGTIGLQVITVPESRYASYIKNVDWIQVYIFPGGFLPSLGELNSAISKHSNFHMYNVSDIGYHYAETLRRWRKDFEKNFSKLPQKNYDLTFYRMWVYYLYTCEAGFENRIINNLQLILTRPQNEKLPGLSIV